jgi:hypothetical protein
VAAVSDAYATAARALGALPEDSVALDGDVAEFWGKWKQREIGKYRTTKYRRLARTLLDNLLSGTERHLPDEVVLGLDLITQADDDHFRTSAEQEAG